MVRKSRTSRVARASWTARPTSKVSLDGEEPPRPPRAWKRHLEVALATLLWGCALPVLFSVPANSLVLVDVVLLVTLSALVLHSFSQRPFYTEVIPEAEDGLAEPDEDQEEKDSREEIKLMITCLVLLSAVGCVVSLGLGGNAAFHAWFSAGTSDCSVAELAKLQEAGYHKFFCNDGFMDTSMQASLLRKGGGYRGSMQTLRLAPIFKADSQKAPVAWAVARDSHFAESPCGSGTSGLCGLLIPPAPGGCMSFLVCFSQQERNGLTKLQSVIQKDLDKEGGDIDFDLGGLPLVLLTDPSDPEGNRKHLLRGMGMWAFTLIGLVGVLVELLVDELCRNTSSTGPYQALPPMTTIPEEDMSRQNSF